MRNTVSPDKVTISVVTRVAGLFILAVVAIGFFASPMLSFAANSPPQTCVGGPADPPPQPATFMAAFTVKVGTKPNDIPTFTPEQHFKPAATKTFPVIELVKLKLNNNKIVFALFEDYDNGYGYATDIQREDVTLRFKLP